MYDSDRSDAAWAIVEPQPASSQPYPAEAAANRHRLLAGGYVAHVIRTAAEPGVATKINATTSRRAGSRVHQMVGTISGAIGDDVGRQRTGTQP
jgi:hypothetical protein